MVLTYMFAFVLSLAFEAPMLSLEKLIFNCLSLILKRCRRCRYIRGPSEAKHHEWKHGTMVAVFLFFFRLQKSRYLILIKIILIDLWFSWQVLLDTHACHLLTLSIKHNPFIWFIIYLDKHRRENLCLCFCTVCAF